MNEQTLQVVANAAVIGRQSEAIRVLRLQVAKQTKRLNRIEAEAIANLSVAVTEQGKRIEQVEAMVRGAGEAIVNLGAGGIELDARIVALETEAARDAAIVSSGVSASSA